MAKTETADRRNRCHDRRSQIVRSGDARRLSTSLCGASCRIIDSGSRCSTCFVVSCKEEYDGELFVPVFLSEGHTLLGEVSQFLATARFLLCLFTRPKQRYSRVMETETQSLTSNPSLPPRP